MPVSGSTWSVWRRLRWEGLAARQLTRLDPSGGDDADVGRLIDNLGNRLGFSRMHRFALRPSHRPERAVRRAPPLPPSGAAARPREEESWPDLRRPLRLLTRPEAVEAVAPLPDAPPLLFRWRRRIHRITRAEGPERLAGEWWRETEPDRDYYCVEDEAGCRFWLYREGAYGGEAVPRWFLHGVFP